MTTINLSTPTNRVQPVHTSTISTSSEKYSLNKEGNSQAIQIKDNEFFIVSFSQTGKKLLEDKKEAELKEKMRQVFEENRVKSDKLAEQNKAAKKEAAAKKIGEVKKQMKGLLDRMRQVLLLGDKRSAALIAKEAARLAKELAMALKDSGSTDIGGSLSVPVVNADGLQESADVAESAENINAEEIEAEAKAGADGQLAAAEEAASEVENAEEADQAHNQATGTKEIANEMLAKAKNDSLKVGHEDEIKQIFAMLKVIVSMVKGTMKMKNSNSVANNPPENSYQANEIEKDSEKAIKEIEKAIKSIADAE
jgi:hypothetical protein